jgi:beta-galactosidase GanA
MKLHSKRWSLEVLFLLAMPFASLSVQGQSAPPIPRLEKTGSQYHFLVDGKAFLMLGGQAHNSSASNPRDLEPVWNSLVGIHANTAEVPLYWELIELQPGQFDFHLVDAAIEGARAHNLRLVFLWFASWKNGEMHYTPEWVKRDTKKFTRVVSADGQPLDILAPTCAACREADANAFAKVMAHIKSVDENRRTVIMMQVENETGLLGSDRDYSPEATRLFNAAVPGELMTFLAGHRSTLSPYLAEAWKSNGERPSGTWSEVFGPLAAETFSAWHVARYVDAVTAAGKQAYPLPMYVNNWLINPGNERAGRWPSGGPTRNVLDIWKAAAPHIDLLAPDIYLPVRTILFLCRRLLSTEVTLLTRSWPLLDSTPSASAPLGLMGRSRTARSQSVPHRWRILTVCSTLCCP